MEQAEMQAILSHVFNRLQRLEADMSVLQTKEKDLRAIMVDGFAKAADFHVWVRSKFEESGKKFGEVNQKFGEFDQKFAKIDQRFTKIDQRFVELEDQIDTLAIQTNLRFDGLEKRMDKTDARIDKIDNKTDILDQRTRDTNLKIDKILNYLAIA